MKHFLLGAAAFIALLVFAINISDLVKRYRSWQALSPTHITETTQWYLENRAPQSSDIIAVCVYAVDCSGDWARLALIRDLDQYDFDALRDRIWARRFDGVCTGRTANLGLSLLSSSDDNTNRGHYDAVWSFYHNRFISRFNAWRFPAFSLEPWERCTIENATYNVRDGVLTEPTD